MICSKCHSENPENRKFCKECGAGLCTPCPHCGSLNVAEDKYCGECGHSLRDADKRVRVPDSERRYVTVLISDLTGYTAMSEKLDPEETKEIMTVLFKGIAQVITRLEGFLERFAGDAVMAVFGVPRACEDGPIRAIRAAQEIHQLINKRSPEVEKKIGQALSMHTGINTGIVITEEVDLEKGKHGMMGDTINVASRLSGIAKADEILVGYESFHQAEEAFLFKALDPVKLKGKRESVKAYRVIGVATRESRFDISVGRGLTPLVGRRAELELLMEGFDRCREGRGQVFSIVAEAGVGKSRLLYEFKKALTGEDITFLEGRCPSYGRHIAYHPITEMLKSSFRVAAGDGDTEVREKVQEGLKKLGVEESSSLPYLLEMLSVRDSGIDNIPMSQDARKDRMIGALQLIALKGSEIRPLIIAIEDLQWIDQSSEDTLRHLIDSIPGVKVFLILTYRPEFSHTWSGRSYYSQVNLNKLSNQLSREMAGHLLGTKEIDKDLEKLILEKTEGVPFFLEEFTKYLRDLNIITGTGQRYEFTKDFPKMSLPSRMQDVIMARVDNLPEGAKESLQICSVIEGEFSYTLLKKVTGLPDQELSSRLSVLKRSELLYEKGIYPDTSYFFNHALTRQVVYDSILTKRKKVLHEKIGSAIEAVYQKNPAEHYGVMVEHFMRGENYEKAAQYAKLAHEKAVKSASFTDAIQIAKKRIDSLEQLVRTAEVERERVDARTHLGLTLFLMNYLVEAKEAIAPVAELASKTGEKENLARIYMILGTYHCVNNEDFAKAYEYLELALGLAEEAGDIICLTLANFFYGLTLSWDCRFEDALSHIQQALRINEATGYEWAASEMKSCLSLYIYNYRGDIGLGCETSQAALEIAEKCGDIHSKAIAYTSYGISAFYRGSFEAAEKYLLKGVAFSERINLFSFSTLGYRGLGHTYFELGDYKKSEEHYQKAIDLRERTKLFPSDIKLYRIALAKAKLRQNEKIPDLETLLHSVKENRLRIYAGSIARDVGDILLNLSADHVAEAEEWILRAIEHHRRYQMSWDLAKDCILYGEYHKKRGDLHKAKEKFCEAKEIFERCGAEGWVRGTQELLGKEL
jgi:predicted ATPase/class 3 adenylate cyclase